MREQFEKFQQEFTSSTGTVDHCCPCALIVPVEHNAHAAGRAFRCGAFSYATSASSRNGSCRGNEAWYQRVCSKALDSTQCRYKTCNPAYCRSSRRFCM